MLSKTITINLGITKIYMLPCNEGFMLIDTGYSSDYDKFIKALKREEIDIAEIKYLFLTHHHDDHTGFAQKLKEEFDVTLIVNEYAVELLKNGDSENADMEKPLNKRIKAIMSLFMIFHRDFKFPPVLVDGNDIIISGDNSTIMRDIGIQGEVLYTPGHTVDSMSLVLDNGDTFCGDVAMNFMKFAGTKYRPIYTNNLNDVYKSWKKILKHDAKTIFPAHGNPFSVEKLSQYYKQFNVGDRV